MRRKAREDGPTALGNAYAVSEWDDQAGDAQTREFTEDGELACRHEWRPPQSAEAVGEMVTFDAAGQEIDRRPLRVRD